MNINKHPLDVIYERLFNGYYAKMPPYSFEKDRATVRYLLGYCSKAEYYVAKSKYEMFNWKSTSIKKENRRWPKIVI